MADKWDVNALPLDGARPDPIALNLSTGDQNVAEFSPDGRFVCFDAYDSGRSEVYVATFPELSGKWQVSSDGGCEPRWSRDSREIFYFDRSCRLVAVDVHTTGSVFEAGAAHPLFQHYGRGSTGGGQWRYDVSPDGKRFLVTTPVQSPSATTPITIIANWPALVGSK
jgi:hypothetical protein